ncbi:MAG: hypothetical protein GY790_05745 [Bacteroidetes bacterium]|nr:hypothetical protein [Bacteroidota bacterium]
MESCRGTLQAASFSSFSLLIMVDCFCILYFLNRQFANLVPANKYMGFIGDIPIFKQGKITLLCGCCHHRLGKVSGVYFRKSERCIGSNNCDFIKRKHLIKGIRPVG